MTFVPTTHPHRAPVRASLAAGRDGSSRVQQAKISLVYRSLWLAMGAELWHSAMRIVAIVLLRPSPKLAMLGANQCVCTGGDHDQGRFRSA